MTVVKLVSEKTIEHRKIETLANKQGLADAVLDRAVDFADVKMKGSGQKFFERLERLMEKPEEPPAPKVVPVAEQPSVFAARMAEELGKTLLSCEERTAGGQSKIVVTIDGNPAQVEERIAAISQDVFGEKLDCEILDRQTAETLARLIDSGLLQAAGQTRLLYPPPEKQELSPHVKARMKELKADAGRKLAMARLLVENKFNDGAIQPLKDAVRLLAIFQALENGSEEPDLEGIDYTGFRDAEISGFMEKSSAEQVPVVLGAMEEISNPD